MKILNLYAGIGGNRKLWSNEHDITAVEMNPDIAAVYHDLFPGDNLIVGDAHQYLLDHFHEFDFIWTSPPCQSHSSIRQNISVKYRGVAPVYPDMKLYQEIIFLQHNFPGDWIVENVKPYYKPLIEPNILIDRHLFWSNFFIFSPGPGDFEKPVIRNADIADLESVLGFDLSGYKLPNKRQVLRNCVLPGVGQYILEHAAV